MMQGIAPLVMSELAKTHPDWKTLDMSRQSTGLTVRRYFDWPSTIVQAITDKQLTAVVIFLGPNDPWDIYEPGTRIRFPSKAWADRYAQRVDEILSAAKAHQVYVLWIGLPSMKEERLHTGASIQNAVFHQRSLAFGTDYLSTEPLIGYVNKPYERAALRSGDGIHFTGQGLHKIKQAVLDQLATAAASPLAQP